MVKASAPPSAEVKARAPTRKQTTALEAPLGRDPDILSLVLVLVVGLSSVRDSPPSVRQQVLQPSRSAVTPAPKVFSFQNFFFLAHFLGAFSEIIELEMSNFSRSIDDAQDASGRERRERWGERAGLTRTGSSARRLHETTEGEWIWSRKRLCIEPSLVCGRRPTPRQQRWCRRLPGVRHVGHLPA